MITACSEIKNSYIDRFLRRQGIFDFSSKDEYDILFCDNLKSHDSEIKTENKIYFAGYKLEYLNNIEKFYDFNYFIGFGNELYEKISFELGFDPSKVFDGFIYDEEYENSFEDKEYDIFFVSSSIQENIFENLIMLDWLSVIDILQKLTGKELKIGTNLNKIDSNLMEKTLKEQSRLEKDENDLIRVYQTFKDIIEYVSFDFPLKYINCSKSVYFFDSLDSRIYYGNIFQKSIVPSFKVSMIYDLKKKNKSLSGRKNIWPASIFNDIVIHNSLKSRDPELFNLYKIVDSALFEFDTTRTYSLTKSLLDPGIKKFMQSTLKDDENGLQYNNVNIQFLEILEKIF